MVLHPLKGYLVLPESASTPPHRLGNTELKLLEGFMVRTLEKMNDYCRECLCMLDITSLWCFSVDNSGQINTSTSID